MTEWYSIGIIIVYVLLQNLREEKNCNASKLLLEFEVRIIAETPRLYSCDMQSVPDSIET